MTVPFADHQLTRRSLLRAGCGGRGLRGRRVAALRLRGPHGPARGQGTLSLALNR